MGAAETSRSRAAYLLTSANRQTARSVPESGSESPAATAISNVPCRSSSFVRGNTPAGLGFQILDGFANGTKTARCAFLLAMGRVREPRSNYVGEDSKMNQNPNQKPGQQQQGGQQQGGQQGGQQKPGQQQQGSQRGGQQGGQQQDR